MVMGFAALYPSCASPLTPVGWVERSETHHLTALRPFTKVTIHLRHITRPILGIDPELHHAVERRIRPIRYPRHKPMLDRVDMNVIDVSREIIVIANDMLPIAPLPDAAFAFGGAAL